MTKHDECRYAVSVALVEMAKRWEQRGDMKFTGAEVAEVMQKTAADLAQRAGARNRSDDRKHLTITDITEGQL